MFRFSPEQKHRELLENVIEFGLNQSQYLQEIQERDLWSKGVRFSIFIVLILILACWHIPTMTP